MKHRYNTSWWAPEGDGPLGSRLDNPELKVRMSTLQGLCKNGPIYAVENGFARTKYGNRLIYAEENDGFDRTKYGKVEFKDGRIFINCFQVEKPVSTSATRFISLTELLTRFNKGSSDLPKTVFLRLKRYNRMEQSFDVLIETEGLLPSAVNFILLCSGLVGPTYKGMCINKLGSAYCHLVSHSFPPAVVNGIPNYEPGPGSPRMEGEVFKMGRLKSRFWIQLEDDPIHSLLLDSSV